jgi:hypothetical protein
MIAQVSARTNDQPDLAFYTVADSSYFPGLAAMIGSLRLLGHADPVYVLDCGLDSVERAALAREATVVPGCEASLPHMQAFVLPRARPAAVMALVDADVIFTRRLDDLVRTAAGGRVVGFADRIPDRYSPQWGELLDLGTVPRRTYLNAGLLFVPQRLAWVLDETEARLGRVDTTLIALARGPADYPFSYPNQDVLNPVLAALASPDDVVALETRLAAPPPFRGVRLVDAERLRCRHPDGTEPYALHHLELKPWLAPTAQSVYTRLLTRLLLDPAAPVAVPADRLPVRLRPGAAAAPARAWSTLWAAQRAGRRRLRAVARAARARARSLRQASGGVH